MLFGPSGPRLGVRGLTRGDALRFASRLPLAVIFRAFGARMRRAPTAANAPFSDSRLPAAVISPAFGTPTEATPAFSASRFPAAVISAAFGAPTEATPAFSAGGKPFASTRFIASSIGMWMMPFPGRPNRSYSKSSSPIPVIARDHSTDQPEATGPPAYEPAVGPTSLVAGCETQCD